MTRVTTETVWDEIGVTREQAIVNLLELYRTSSDSDRIFGRQWYFGASEVAYALSNTYEVTYQTACAVLAATSPQAKWVWDAGDKQGNIFRAISVLTADGPEAPRPKGSCMSAQQWKKALKVAFTTSGHNEILTTHKVNAFFHGIASKGTSNEICVDTHMMHACANRVLTEKARVKIFSHKLRYGAIAEAIGIAASEVSEEPQQFQAIVWEAWRNKIKA